MNTGTNLKSGISNLKSGKYISKSLSDTEEFAESLLENLSPKDSGATVVGLCGDLGSGKTTFVQMIAKKLGIKERVQSPTFVILKRYDIESGIFDTLIHIDAYRLESCKDIELLGFEEILDSPKVLMFVEWASKIGEVLPKDYIKLEFSHLKEGERQIEIG